MPPSLAEKRIIRNPWSGRKDDEWASLKEKYRQVHVRDRAYWEEQGVEFGPMEYRHTTGTVGEPIGEWFSESIAG